MFYEASALNYLSVDAPPVHLWYVTPNLPMTPDLGREEGIHHPKFGLLLKEEMDALGVECIVRLREELPDLPREEIVALFHREQVAFLKQHLLTLPEQGHL
jgi:hypothetical protein